MGCNSSKLDDEEAVQLCKDRKKFIKQAVEHRLRFASGHLAYIQSLKRVSAALRDYIEDDEPREFSLDTFVTPPLPPAKRSTPRFITISPKCLSETPAIKSESNTSMKISYYRPSGNPPVSVEERPHSPETVRVESYSSMYNYGIDGFFTMQSPSQNPSSYSYSPNNRPNNIPPPSPQTNQWDFFWNPFSSLDYYGYPSRSNLDQSVIDEDINGLRQLREEEGIPDLEEETEHEDVDSTSFHGHSHGPSNSNPHLHTHGPTRANPHSHSHAHAHGHPQIYPLAQSNAYPYSHPNAHPHARPNAQANDNSHPHAQTHPHAHVKQQRGAHPSYSHHEEVTVEDVDEDEEEDMTSADEIENEENGIQSHGNESIEPSQRSQQVEIHRHENAVGDCETMSETPGFTVYVNRRPTSMDEVIKDLETQFVVVCNSAKEVSALLESNHAQYLHTAHENSPMKMLNPVALFRSGSSRSSSSRFLVSSSSREEGYESSSDCSAESCMISGSHQSTLDRLYAWEKRLYEEVRSGERVRIAYEKKCKQLKNLDYKGEDPNSVDKNRAVIRDLHTQIKVAIHSIEAISKRIETLRDEELHPQLLELVQGLARMWKVMAESHQMQKRTLDDAKLLLAGTPSKLSKSRRNSGISATTAIDPNRLTRSASKLESELRNWKSCFESWVTSQRSYVQCLASWLLRCMRCEPDTSKLPFSPRHSSVAKLAPPIFGLCIQWSRFMDTLHEIPVLDGLDFFAAGMGSIYAQQAREDSRRAHQGGSGSNRFGGEMDVVEYGTREEEEAMAPEKMAEVAVRVLCAGMSVAMSSLTEFAMCSAEGYAELVKQWENVKWPPPLSSDGEEGK